MQKVRVKFVKQGNVRFIGHLDVQRYFQKALRRANVDVSYSEGFSPHQIMSFALPLGLGFESNAEYMDIEINSMMFLDKPKESSDYCGELVRRLNQVGIEGLMVKEAIFLPKDSKNAMASVCAAAYQVTFKSGREPDFKWKEQIYEFMQKKTIDILKKSKGKAKEERVLNLRPGILHFSENKNGDGIYMLLSAGSVLNIKPNEVLEAFYTNNHDIFDISFVRIVREDLFTSPDGSAIYISLGDI